MSTTTRAQESTEKSFFEQQREELITEIALSLEHVLMNMNLLNRSLEGVVAVGKEFESVEALWSQFENVMGKNPEEAKAQEEEEEEGGGGGEDSVRMDQGR